MRDFLTSSDYAIIQATLSLVARLECKMDEGDTFAKFRQLPQKVRTQIELYLPSEEPQLDNRDRVFRFEAYQGEQNQLLLLAFPVREEFEEGRIECVGQYFYETDAFLRQPYAVSSTMVAKVEAMSAGRWSWKQLPSHHRPEMIVCFVAICVAVAAWVMQFAYYREVFAFLGMLSMPYQKGVTAVDIMILASAPFTAVYIFLAVLWPDVRDFRECRKRMDRLLRNYRLEHHSA